jgi:acetylornithine deacetylase/succinyl-diaminopimelate desuccinylase-like protein
MPGVTPTLIVQSISFGYDDVEEWQAAALGHKPGHIYSRNTNPTVAVFEEKILVMEGAEAATSFAFGMAAITNTIFALVKPTAPAMSSAGVMAIRPRALVAAHLDTVFPEGTDVRVERAGSRLDGPGLVDDSRGLAVILSLAEALEAAGVRMRRSLLLFVADVGEEGLVNLRGIKYLVGKGKYRQRLDAFIH